MSNYNPFEALNVVQQLAPFTRTQEDFRNLINKLASPSGPVPYEVLAEELQLSYRDIHTFRKGHLSVGPLATQVPSLVKALRLRFSEDCLITMARVMPAS